MGTLYRLLIHFPFVQNAAATAAEIVKVIQKTEAEFQSSLESSYNQMR